MLIVFTNQQVDCTDLNLINLVKKEAKNLLQHATPQELSRLKNVVIYPYTAYACIYGYMTGSCFSTRAEELIEMCAEPYALELFATYRGSKHAHFGKTSSLIQRRQYYSPIECFSVRCSKKQMEMLLNYLTGKNKTLLLERIK